MGVKSKSYVAGYRIKRGALGIVSTAPIDAVTGLEVDGVMVWEGLVSAGQVYVYAPTAWGGDDKLGGVRGYISILDGNAAQGVNDYLASVLPAPQSARRGLVSVVLEQIEQGKDPRPLPWRTKNQNIYAAADGWNVGIAPIHPEVRRLQSNIYIAMDWSTSMNNGTRWVDLKDGITNFLTGIKGSTGNSFRLVIYGSTIASSIERLNADDDDIDDLIAWVAGLATPGGTATDFDVAVSQFGTFVSDANAAASSVVLTGEQKILSQQGDRQNIILFITDGLALPTGSAADAAATLAALGISYSLFAYNISESDTTYTEIIDNTPSDGVPVVNSENIGAAIAASSPYWVDINPIHIMRDVLLEPAIGGRWTSSDIGTSFAEVAQVLFDEGLGLSFPPSVLARGAAHMKREIERHIDGYFYRSKGTGKWEVKLVRDDYDVADLFVVDGDMIIEWVDEPDSPLPETLPTQVTMTYTRRGSGDQAAMTDGNPAAITADGPVIPDSSPPDFPGITHDDTARDVLLREITSRTLPLTKGGVRVRYAPTSLVLGEPFIIDDPEVGISNMVVRLRERTNPDGKSNSVVLWWGEDRYRQATATGFSSVETPATIVASGPVAMDYEFVMEMPYWQLATEGDQDALDVDLAEEPDLGYWIASGAKPNAKQIDIVLAKDTGAQWLQVGRSDFSPHLVLNTAVDGQATSTTLVCAYRADAVEIAAADLMLIDDEIVRVDAATSDGVEVTLTVGRGCLDTVPRAHAVGAALMLWQGYALGDGLGYVADESLDLKLLPRAGSDILPPGSATLQAFTLAARARRPYPVGRLKVNGSYAPSGKLSGTATVTCVGRDRTVQTTLTPEDHDDLHIDFEAGVYLVLIRRLIDTGSGGEVVSHSTEEMISFDPAASVTAYVDLDDATFSAYAGAATIAMEIAVEARIDLSPDTYANWQTAAVRFATSFANNDSAVSSSVPPGFTPSDDANAFAWWDMSDTASIILLSGYVDYVDDQLGTYALDSTGVTTTSGVDTLNGLNVITNPGTAGSIRNNAFSAPASGNCAIHGIVSIDTVDNASDSIFGWNGPGSTDCEMRLEANNSSQFDGELVAVFTGAVKSTVLTGGPWSGWVNFSIIFDWDNSNYFVYIGDTLVADGTGKYTTKMTTSTMYLLVANTGTSGRMAGKIAEVIWTEDVSNRSDYHGYLQGKWNVA